MDEIRFEDRVVIVTGGGRGIGRAHAQLFAARGAKVVVNDLGAFVDGSERDESVAGEVVREIEAEGGSAVSDARDISDFAQAEALIQETYDRWGRVDAVVANAGILQDRAFVNMSEAEWDAVTAVHLKGTFNVARAAWPLFRSQAYGRLVVTSSASGLYGNFGQANYGAMKLGVVGLMHVLSIEGAKYNITCNAIAPNALSRMTEALLADELAERIGPEHIAPAVVFMASEQCTQTGLIIQAGAGQFCRTILATTPPVTITDGHVPATLEQVAEQWDTITDVSGIADAGNLSPKILDPANMPS